MIINQFAQAVVKGDRIAPGSHGIHTVEGVKVEGDKVVIRCSQNTMYNTRAFRAFVFPLSAIVRTYR